MLPPVTMAFLPSRLRDWLAARLHNRDELWVQGSSRGQCIPFSLTWRSGARAVHLQDWSYENTGTQPPLVPNGYLLSRVLFKCTVFGPNDLVPWGGDTSGWLSARSLLTAKGNMLSTVLLQFGVRKTARDPLWDAPVGGLDLAWRRCFPTPFQNSSLIKK